MQNQKTLRVGYDNVAFEDDGMRIVGTVIGMDDDETVLVGNPYFDSIWHVPVGRVTITDEPMNEPPAEW